MNHKSATPRDASAVVLLDAQRTKVLWAQRNPKIPFLGGFHAFPGGKTDSGDSEIEVKNCADPELAKFIVSAARELFEEVGVLLVRNGEKLTKGQRASLHDDLISGRSTFAGILDDWGLWLDAGDFSYIGYWTTPNFSPVRFKTRFFVAVCPPKQTPHSAITEMLNVEFIEPKAALQRWSDSEVLISPPVLISLQELAAFESEHSDENWQKLIARLLKKAEKCDGNINFVELNPRLICFPLRTKTLPPATHTNCFIVGKQNFVVIDAASRDEDELAKLFELTDSFIEKGYRCEAIVVSHLHQDHFGGEAILQKRFRDKFGIDVPLVAHRVTAESLAGEVEFQRFLEDDEPISLADADGNDFDLTVLHTPGHARGHLCFYDRERGFLLSSDNVVGAGTVVIAQPEGNMSHYFASLERMRNLPHLRNLCGSHGAAIYDAKAKIDEYIAHRLDRERQIIAALQSGNETPEKIAEVVYHGLDVKLFPLAVETVRAHLAKIDEERDA